MSESTPIRSPHLKNSLDYLTKRPAFSLFVIVCASLLLRLYYFPYNVPLILDSLNYFFYATDTSILGHFPSGYNFPNNGWPALVSVFFSTFHFNNFLDYMTLQRLLSVSVSTLTTIPVYFLCNRFFNRTYSLLGALLFAFEPHVIQNSLLGITDPLYILLATTSLFLLMSNKIKAVYASFAIASLCAMARYEGLLLFGVLSIVFFLRFRRENKVILRYLLGVSIFVLLLVPVAYVRIQTTGSDGLTSHIIAGGDSAITISSSENSKFGFLGFVATGFENLFKYLGWISLPFFIFFLPTGIYYIFKNRDYNKITVIISIIIMTIPALYAYARGIQDTRYLYILYPLFCIMTIFTIQAIRKKMKASNIFLILIVGGIVFSSIIFLDIKKYDYEHQRESFEVGNHVAVLANGINDYYPEDSYIIPAELPENWPALKTSVNFHVHAISTQGFDSLEKYIKDSKSKGLTHLVLDGDKDRPAFLNDVYFHDEKYPYLLKVYDSTDNKLKYHVKIYQINYNKFDQIN
ncbi:MAG: glycosyltransferase family 39 protein [Thaumarchaeota archaeon]|nr:glycosyltransferase family 39 protein [Nitrososphaerota archaeon]